MKISASKKQLAKIISENGGWRDGVEFSVSTCDGVVIGSGSKPRYTTKYGWVANGGFFEDRIKLRSYLKNWHQTIVSRDEYFHLYTAPDAISPMDFGVVDDFGRRYGSKPTIEQLAAEYRNRQDYAERKQQEADDAKADAEVKLAKLVAAGKAHGLVLSVTAPEPELVITDWRDLQVGDYVEFKGVSGEWEILDLESEDDGAPIKVDESIDCECIVCGWVNTNVHKWRFIRRP